MIVSKTTNAWQTNGNFPDTNFSDRQDVWVVPDGSALAAKIKSLGRRWDAVLDDAGNLIDVIANDPDYACRVALAATQKQARQMREPLLKAFDIYKTNVSYGIETESETERDEIIAWYNALLNLPSTVTASGEVDLPETPEKIKYYL